MTEPIPASWVTFSQIQEMSLENAEAHLAKLLARQETVARELESLWDDPMVRRYKALYAENEDLYSRIWNAERIVEYLTGESSKQDPQ